MLEEHGWRLIARCSNLSPKEADDLFFPGPGGKPHKARQFCSSGNGCPFKGICLKDAIEKKLEGFFAGTTIDERNQMKSIHYVVTGLDMPPEPDPSDRKILLKVFSPDDVHNWLDHPELEPSEEELAQAS